VDLHLKCEIIRKIKVRVNGFGSEQIFVNSNGAAAAAEITSLALWSALAPSCRNQFMDKLRKSSVLSSAGDKRTDILVRRMLMLLLLLLWPYSPLFGLGSLFSFLILYTFGRTP
jgi:hypothetical protein